jgi:hypothetical protein
MYNQVHSVSMAPALKQDVNSVTSVGEDCISLDSLPAAALIAVVAQLPLRDAAVVMGASRLLREAVGVRHCRATAAATVLHVLCCRGPLQHGHLPCISGYGCLSKYIRGKCMY